MNAKMMLKLQTLFLFIGVIVSWENLFEQFTALYRATGSVLSFSGPITNPIATPCFYGALAFAVALFWSVRAYQGRVATHERALGWFLLLCVVFSVSVFSYETAEYFKLFNPGAFAVSCTPGVPPFQTPCFYGTLCFIAAFATSFLARKRLGSALGEETSHEG